MKQKAVTAAAVAITLALAGCASADKNVSDTTGSVGSSASSASGSAGAVAGSTSKMSMSSNTTTVVNAQGVPTPVPVKTIGSGTWNAMRITAQETTPVPFYKYNGTSFSEVKPAKSASFHLMVMLSDVDTGVAIPYATVWATFYKGAKMVYNEEQYPMLARYMGPHYGNDVSLPGPGTYTLKLLVSAPEAALHVEYAHMWTGTHTMTSTFKWTSPSGI